MVKKLLLVCMLALLSLNAHAYENLAKAPLLPEKYMVSPYHSITNIGDPYVFYDTASSKYYMYVTGGNYFKCYSSDTMKVWTPEGDSYTVSEKSFGKKNYWAPEVYERGGEYYMVYSAMNDAGRHSIGLAKAKSPTGPFTDVYDHPLYAPDYSVIDASLFFDDDGKVYLLYSKDCSENVVSGMKTSQSFGIELKSDLSGTVGAPVLLTSPIYAWESKSGTTRWNEGPFMFKSGDTYYLLFSANFYATENYSVGYATAKNPLGPFVKASNNPLVVGDGKYTSGTGHCALTRSPDGTEIYISYHTHNNPADLTKVNRIPALDKLVVRADGTLKVSGPSFTKQPLPSGANGLYKKYDGVSVTSAYKTVWGDVKHLTDGIVSHDSVLGDAVYRFVCDSEQYIEVRYDAPITLDSLWVYGVYSVSMTPKKVYAVVNGEYVSEKYTFSSAVSLDPVVIGFGGLPANVKVENVKLYFEGRDAFTPVGAISEIITVYK